MRRLVSAWLPGGARGAGGRPGIGLGRGGGHEEAGRRDGLRHDLRDRLCAGMPAAAALWADHAGADERSDRLRAAGSADRSSARSPGGRGTSACRASLPRRAYPVYSGEGAIVNVRKRGSATVLATLPVVEGHFKIRLGAGEYVLHPYLPEEPCWSGVPVTVKVTARTARADPGLARRRQQLRRPPGRREVAVRR